MQLKIKMLAIIVVGVTILLLLYILATSFFMYHTPSVNWDNPGFRFYFNESTDNNGSYLDMHYINDTRVDVAIVRPGGIIGNDSVPPSDGTTGRLLENNTTYRFFLDDSSHVFIMTFFVNGMPSHVTVYYHMPFFTVEKVKSGNKTYLDVFCYREQVDRKNFINYTITESSEVENLRFVSGTDGNDSTPPARGLIESGQKYRFELNGSADRLIGFAIIDGKDVEIFNCSIGNLPNDQVYYSKYPLT